MTTPQRIALVGGGISGMGAAWALSHSQDRFDFRLFEAQDRLGGNAEAFGWSFSILESLSGIAAFPNRSWRCSNSECSEEAAWCQPPTRGRLTAGRDNLTSSAQHTHSKQRMAHHSRHLCTLLGVATVWSSKRNASMIPDGACLAGVSPLPTSRKLYYSWAPATCEGP